MSYRWPLTARLTLWYSLVSAALLLGLAGLVFRAVTRHFEELDRATLQDKIHLVQDILTSADTPTALQRRLDDALRNHPGLFVRIDHADGRVLYSAAFRFPPAVLTTPVTVGAETVAWEADGHTYLALGATVPKHPKLGSAWRVWTVMDNLHHAHFLHSLRTALGLYVALATALSGLLGWWAARVGLAPLRAMKARAQGVTALKLDARMQVDEVPVEMAELARSLNDMLARLQSDFQRLSAFSSDLAHELRTPISNLLTQTQVALSQQRTAVDYRDILASNAEEFQRLSRMVSDMLLLAKAEHGLLQVPRLANIDLAHEVSALFDFYEALAEEKGVRLSLQGTAQVQGDSLMLRRAISNLLSNAMRYAPEASEIVVRLEPIGATGTRISVANRGEPIPPDILPRLFDRFFRADKARAHHDSDGAGLGLSITKAIAQAHGGAVCASSQDGKNVFSIELPW